MERLNKDKALLKYVIGVIDTPTHLGLLYEIVNFLNEESRMDGVFITKELNIKTKTRVNDLSDDIKQLVSDGYLKKEKERNTYSVVSHPWV